MAAHWWRIGVVRGPTMLGVLVAGVLVTALVITGRWQAPDRPTTRPRSPQAAATPVSLGPTWACPLGAPVPGSPTTAATRPVTRPAPQRPAGGLLPDRHAGDRGRLSAGAPTGRDSGGRRGLPDPHRGAAPPPLPACRRRPGLPGPCPTLLPALSPGAVPPAPCHQRFACEEGYGFGFVLEEDGFVVPPGYVGAAGQAYGRLVVAAAN